MPAKILHIFGVRDAESGPRGRRPCCSLKPGFGGLANQAFRGGADLRIRGARIKNCRILHLRPRRRCLDMGRSCRRRPQNSLARLQTWLTCLILNQSFASAAHSRDSGGVLRLVGVTRRYWPGTGALCRYEWLWRNCAHAHAEGQSSAAAPSMWPRIRLPGRRSSSRLERRTSRSGAPLISSGAESSAAPSVAPPAWRRGHG